MSQNDYTPARLRDLADNAFDAEFRVLQAALRAAADAIQERDGRCNGLRATAVEALEQRDAALATLAAREALLTKALDVLEDHFFHRRLALAAEIAAALKETDQ